MQVEFRDATTVPSKAFPRSFQSSAVVPWRGFLVEKHLDFPGERPASTNDRHVIAMHCGHPARLEYRGACGRWTTHVETAGNITILPLGPSPAVRLHTRAELIHCALEDDFVRRILAEMDCRPAAIPAFRRGLRDNAIQRVLDLLLDELEAEAPSGRLYVESLAHALATRYLLLDGTPGMKSESQTSPLPPRILNRIRDRIEADIHNDVSLEALAEESGYSRAHFLRMFRVATGITPHQYILSVRLNRAQDSLRRKSASLIDIAACCGFSSQAHMTSVFRKRLGVTPAEFRRG